MTSSDCGSGWWSGDCNCGPCTGYGALGLAVLILLLMLAAVAAAIYSILPAAAMAIGGSVGYAMGAALAALVALACPCTAFSRARRAAWAAAWTSSAVHPLTHLSTTDAVAAPAGPAAATTAAGTPNQQEQLPGAEWTTDGSKQDAGGLHPLGLVATVPTEVPAQLCAVQQHWPEGYE
ncbi:hypothetical protein ABPG75_007017 [Micractinium tetrahymenae]